MNKILLFITLFVVCTFSSAIAAERFVIPLDDENNLSSADKAFNINKIKVDVSMTRPVEAFQPITFTFSFSENGKPVKIENGIIRFNMKMDMGDYTSKLVEAEGKYNATTTLPKCMMGGEIWFANLRFTASGTEHSKVFFFKIPNK